MKKITLLFAFLLAFVGNSYAQFPAPYCGPLAFAASSGVEPITLVNFAGINNTSSNGIGAAGENIQHEDFTAVAGGAVVAGSTYPITIKGNTGGTWTNRFNVYADWNHDGDFADAGEAYVIAQSIYNSDGTDAVQAVQDLVVPADALAGATRVRVKKTFGGATLYPDPCVGGGAGFGQAEDYTVTVTVPTCLAPSAGIAAVVSNTAANLSWTSPGANAEVLVQLATLGAPADADGTGTNVIGASTFAATGLTANTQYEFYVRNECTAGTGFSTWSGPFAFVTTLAPSCATNPTPADGAINIPTGDVTFSWTAPSTGDAATSYDMYYGLTPGNATILVANFTTTTAEITLDGYDTVFYWKIVPKNAGGASTGCVEWSFTTEPQPPAPANDTCGTAVAITSFPYTETLDATFSAEDGVITACEDGEFGGMNDGVWYTVVGNGLDLTVTISDVDGWDPQVDVYTGTCGAFTCVTSADETGGDSDETVVISGSVVGTTYYINIGDYDEEDDYAEGPFKITVVSSTIDTPDYVSLQAPISQTTPQGTPITVYGQVYESGLTDVAPTTSQAPGIEAWVGVNATDTNPNTWTTWTVATYNAGHVSNNDEYSANVGAALVPGTYYYATRFRLNNGPFVYGGVDAAGNGNFWNGTTHVSGVLTVTTPPVPANDDCAGATALVVGGVFADQVITGTNVGSTTAATGLTYTCQPNRANDVWYSVVVPASGNVTIETRQVTGSGLTDSVVSIFSGTCGALAQVGCNDDDGDGAHSKATATGQAVGSTLLVGVWKWNNSTILNGQFQISAYDASLGNDSFNNANFSYYPNPVKNVLNLSYTENISNVAVYNLIGQQVIAKAINANESQIDMSALAAGTYVVKVTANNQVKTIKVIKE